MLPTPNEFRLQAILLILFGCSVLTGLISFAVEAMPFLAVPERLTLSPEGAPAIILIGFAVLALTFPGRFWRMLAGGLVSIFGLYGLIRWLLSLWSGVGLHPVSVSYVLDLLPPLALLLMAGVSFLGVRSARGSLFGFITGCTSVGIGAIVLVSHLYEGLDAEANGLGAGFSMIGGLYCIAFGAVLVLLSEQKASRRFSVHCKGASIGLLAVTGTFVLFLLASWTINMQRHQEARTILQHYQEILEHGVDEHVRLIDRLAGRWAAADNDVPDETRRREVSRYYPDKPALDALMVVRGEGQPLWRSARSPGDLLWLMDQVVKPDVLSWLRRAREQNIANSWFFPDSSDPFKVLSLVATNRAAGEFLAVFDIREMLAYEVPNSNHEFDLALKPVGPALGKSDPSLNTGLSEIRETTVVELDPGASVLLTAKAGPPALFSLRFLFPMTVLLFGLWMSYLLIVGRNLLGAYKDQAKVLGKAEQEFRSLFSRSPDTIIAFDKQGYYRALNSVAKTLVGLDDSDVGVTHYQTVLRAAVITEDDKRRFETAFSNAVAGHTQSFEIGFVSPGSSDIRNYECDFLPIVVDDAVTGAYFIAKDITEKLQSQENQRILKRSLESTDNGVVIVDHRAESLPVVYVNPAFCRMTGYSEAEVIGAPARLLTGPETEEADIRRIRRAVKAGRCISLTMKSYRRDGTPFWNQLSVTPVRDPGGEITHYTAIMRDISDKKEQEQRLAYQATHDVLTGLGNRALFEDHLKHDVSLAKRSGQVLAVLFIDLDEFKPINDTLGHKVGDELLISVARKLETVIRPTDTLVRFGGDEFVLLLPDVESVRGAENVAERVLEELSKPHVIGSHELFISASIGISVLSDDLDQPEKLLQHADMAMYKAKQQGRDTYELFSPDLDNKLSRRVALRNELQEAIQSGQLVLHYQPQVDLFGYLCGLEALVRWKHPERGFISPADFIPMAEETGQIVQLGKWVTTQACRDAKRLQEMGLLRGRMAVNLSPLQFHRRSFLSSVRSILAKTGLRAEYLELELTEGILMRDTDGAVDILNALAGMGIATAIDDFGTGYSCFAYLRNLPVDKIKIDRSFVDRVTTNDKDAAVCKGVITLARELDLKVIAEGVETEEQVRFLSGNGCEAFQGYYFARPMAFDDLVEWSSQGVTTEI
ncbi:PAS domain S-box-containing protein/diguanylate cyclase (GGDEF)-like protein [Marinobacter pelagius]|uniref:cyclic-guanylate-specific phosphodiesterase n=1 Tax=Marinobacter pelagius TaxID=379482 RepID=A0A366GQP1_9GAMM|nr:EAL domain-containing protein [Marinobacter pelagius]RBP30024.1 PAS domain S-box-containing protein/diguanylate cyclase (GGDEF)-like protein [Marinobacter pelagius]